VNKPLLAKRGINISALECKNKFLAALYPYQVLFCFLFANSLFFENKYLYAFG